MLPQVEVMVTVSTPEKQPYWMGYDQFIQCYFSGDRWSPEELASMSDGERRGYEAAARHQADTETDSYVARLNTNSFGDRTEW